MALPRGVPVLKVLCVIMAIPLAWTIMRLWSNALGGQTSSIFLQPLRVPQDVEWFLHEDEGWLCDYKYVERNTGNGSLVVLKILPRNTGLGKILVYSVNAVSRTSGYRLPFIRDARYGHVNNFFTRSFHLLAKDEKWVVIAMNQWGELDKMFASIAKFGDSIAFDALISAFHVGQEIRVRSISAASTGKDQFPGIKGVDKTIYAFA